jgi:hypothetical protein
MVQRKIFEFKNMNSISMDEEQRYRVAVAAHPHAVRVRLHHAPLPMVVSLTNMNGSVTVPEVAVVAGDLSPRREATPV